MVKFNTVNLKKAVSLFELKCVKSVIVITFADDEEGKIVVDKNIHEIDLLMNFQRFIQSIWRKKFISVTSENDCNVFYIYENYDF